MSQSGSSFPIGKVLLGCGCLSALGVGIALTLVLAGGYWGAKKIQESELGALVQEGLESPNGSIEPASQGGAGSSNGSTKEASRSPSPSSSGKKEYDVEQMLGWSHQALTPDDIKHHIAAMKAWQASPHSKSMASNVGTLKELGEKQNGGGAIDTLRSINAMKNMAQSSAEAEKELDAIAKKHGGHEALIRRYAKLLAVSGAASGVAADQQIASLVSDETAAAMKRDHADAKKTYRIWSKLHKESYKVLMLSESDPDLVARLSQDPDFKQANDSKRELDRLQRQNPGYLVLGMIPAGSVATWGALSEEERKRLIKEYIELPGLFGLLAFALNDQAITPHESAKRVIGLEYNRLVSESVKEAEAAKSKATP